MHRCFPQTLPHTDKLAGERHDAGHGWNRRASMCHGDIHGNAKCSRTELNRHKFLQHPPECENYEATIRNIKPCKNRALIVNPLANNVSQREFHSHSLINRPPKPAWLKELAVIDLGPCRRFYRQARRAYADAGDGAICGAAILVTPWSIGFKDTEKDPSAKGRRGPCGCGAVSCRELRSTPRFSGCNDRPVTFPASLQYYAGNCTPSGRSLS